MGGYSRSVAFHPSTYWNYLWNLKNTDAWVLPQKTYIEKYLGLGDRVKNHWSK